MVSAAPEAGGKRVLLVGGCGYIGSYLYPRLVEAGFRVTVCDLLRRGNPLGLEVIQSDYEELGEGFLKGFDAVLWFGGHASVKQAMDDPDGAIANNCLNLFSFAKRLPSTTKFIYASSASLYSTKEIGDPSSEDSLVAIPSQNAYDISKFAFDYLANHFLPNFYGLRMGTVSGFSANLRPELIFNAMNIAAVEKGFVTANNKESLRTILFLSDLWVLVRTLLTTDQARGFYNAGSLSFKIGELAQGIADTWDVGVVDQPNSGTYSFSLNCGRMKTLCGESLHPSTLQQSCRDFIAQYKKHHEQPLSEKMPVLRVG